MVGEEKPYYYYQLTTNKGFSGKVILGALVSPENTVIATEFIGGDEDGLGISAAKKLLITPENPYKSGTPVQSGASAGKTLPAIGEALDAILADAKGGNGGGSTHNPEYKNIVTASEKIGKELIDASVKDVEVKVEESKAYVNAKKEIKFEGDEATYFFYDLNSAKGFTGKVNFGAIIDSEPKVISYVHIGGDEDGLGMAASKYVTIDLEHPYKAGDTVQSGSSAASTLPAIGKALDAALADAGGAIEKLPSTVEELVEATSTLIGKKVTEVKEADMVVTESIQYASTMNKRTLKFEGDEDTYYFYKLHTKTHESFSGEVHFAVIINKKAEVISFVLADGSTEDNLGMSVAKTIVIDLEHPYTAGSEIQTGATAKKTIPAIQKAMDAAIADVQATIAKEGK